MAILIGVLLVPWFLTPVAAWATWQWAKQHKLQAGDVKYVQPEPAAERIEIAVAKVVADGIAEALRAVTGVGVPDGQSIIVPGEDAYEQVGTELEARWEKLLGDVEDADLGPELKWEGANEQHSGWLDS